MIAPYLLTALLEEPTRLVYLSSGLASNGRAADLAAVAWATGSSYGQSKLFVTALAFAAGRLRPSVASNAVNPGWVLNNPRGIVLIVRSPFA